MLVQAIVFFSKLVHSQCGSTLVDDYSSVDVHDYDGASRNFNKMGGDYGQQGVIS
jgi:hypothetical protein